MVENAFQIRSSAAAAVFSDSRRRRLILEFAKGPCSMSEMSAATGMPLSLLSYHVRRLQGLGLLRFVRAQARGGRPIKFYEAVAKAFFVPADLASEPPSHEMTKALRTALDQAEIQSGGAGMLYFLDAERRPRMRRLAGATSRSAEFWRRLALTHDEARELAAEMEALLGRYGMRARASAKQYLVLCALAPWKD